jgi:hypothetical protein
MRKEITTADLNNKKWDKFDSHLQQNKFMKYNIDTTMGDMS